MKKRKYANLKELEKKFGELVDQAIIHIFYKGIHICKGYSDGYIESVIRYSYSTPKDWERTLMKVAREIVQLDLYEEILPYIKKRMDIITCPCDELTLYLDDFTEESKQELLKELKLNEKEGIEKAQVIKVKVIDKEVQ